MKLSVAIVEDNHDIRTGMMMMINNTDELECRQTFSSAERLLKYCHWLALMLY
jgi:DNA-binding NarL/FixJ family response regulator